MATVTIWSDFGAQEKKICHSFPICLPWSDGTECQHSVFWTLSFKPAFSLSSFTFTKGLFSPSSLSATRVMSPIYLRLLFLSAILIPACASSSPAFHTIYSAYKLNKQSDSIQPWRTPFPIWKQFIVPCRALTVASWSAYRFLKRWSGIPISLRIVHSLLLSTTVQFVAITDSSDPLYCQIQT